MPDSDQMPLALVQSRWRGVAFLMGGFFATLVGLLSFAQWNTGGLFTIVSGIGGAALGVVMLRKPTTLVLSSDGLTFVNLGIRRAWRWPDISGFQLTSIRSGTVITFREYGEKFSPAGRLYSVPSHWNVPSTQAVELLNAAQTRWS